MRDKSEYSAHDILSLGFISSLKHAALLEHTRSIADVHPADYDALFVAGGQGPMITMIDDERLHTFVADFYESGKVVAVVCHGTCILLKTKLSSGALLVEGKTWTGFANSEEEFATPTSLSARASRRSLCATADSSLASSSTLAAR